MKYHSLVVSCPQCHVKCQTTEVAFRIDGMILIEGICDQCEQEVELEIPYADTLVTCVEEDQINLFNWKPSGRPS